MITSADPETAPPHEGTVDQRRAPRFEVVGVRCGLARVLDVSASGLRLNSPLPWKIGLSRWVRLRHHKHSGRVRARCVWRRREGLRWILGIAFDDNNAWRVKQAVEIGLRGRMQRP